MTEKGSLAWIKFGGGLKLWRELYEPFGVIPYPMGSTGVQMGGWFNKKINYGRYPRFEDENPRPWWKGNR